MYVDPLENSLVSFLLSRIVEQLVLFRRILYYLKYVFAQVKDAVAENRLKPTSVAKKSEWLHFSYSNPWHLR